MLRDSELSIQDLCGNEAVEALELADDAGGIGFADEVDAGWDAHYARTETAFTPEEEAEMEALFSRSQAAASDPDRTPPAGAHPVRLAA